jgi:hypothetical protein
MTVALLIIGASIFGLLGVVHGPVAHRVTIVIFAPSTSKFQFSNIESSQACQGTSRSRHLSMLVNQEGVNSVDSLCQTVFCAHGSADGRSLLPHLSRLGGIDRTRQDGGRDLRAARRGGR